MQSEAWKYCGDKKYYKSYKCWNRSFIDKYFFDCQLYVITLTGNNAESDDPKEYVEADNEEGSYKSTVIGEERIHNGNSEKSDVAEYHSEFRDLTLVEILDPYASEKCYYSHNYVHRESKAKAYEGKLKIFGRVGLAYDRIDYKSRLSYSNNEL